MARGSRSPAAFRRAVEAAVRTLGPGQVATYGEVAAQAGYPGAARGVGGVLRAAPDLPWWRVVGADGRLIAPAAAEQARRLHAEGVRVDGGRLAG